MSASCVVSNHQPAEHETEDEPLSPHASAKCADFHISTKNKMREVYMLYECSRTARCKENNVSLFDLFAVRCVSPRLIKTL